MEQISQIKQFAVNNSVPIIQDEGIDFIIEYIREHKVKNILEIGTAIGYSSIKFANLADDIFVSTIEYDLERYQQAVRNVHDNNLMDRITLYLGDALKYELSDKFDLIFIDGAKAQYINFFEHFKHNLSENGVFISDNLSFHGMVEDLSLTHNDSTIRMVKKLRKYINFLKTNLEFETTFYKLGDGLSVSKKKPCCKWCLDPKDNQSLLQHFHDEIWGSKNDNDSVLLEILNLKIMQKNTNLKQVLLNKDLILKALMHFNLKRLSNLTDEEINISLKILEGTPFCDRELIITAKENTKTFVKVQTKYESFANYIWGFTNNQSVRLDNPNTNELIKKVYNSLLEQGFINLDLSFVNDFLQSAGIINAHEEHCWKY